MRHAAFLPATLAAALVAAACGAGVTPGPAATVAPRTIQVGIGDFFFAPALITLQSGETVTLVLKNAATLEHTFMAGRGAEFGKGFSQDWLAPAMSMPAGHDKGAMGQGVRIPVGATTVLTLVVPDEGGEFEFGCFIPGHYEGGMKGKLLVEGRVGGATVPPKVAPSRTPGATATPMGSMGDEDAEAH